MTFHYIILITEWKPYLDMYSDIQGYKYNWFKSKDNKLKLNSSLIMTIGYFLTIFGFSKFLGEKLYKVNLFSFIFIICIWSTWDFSYYTIFEAAYNYIPVLLYDIFISGGLCLVLTQLIFNKYYKILEKNIPMLVLLYFVTMFLFLYVCYKYNPDISNITGIYQPFHFLFFILFMLLLTYYVLKLK